MRGSDGRSAAGWMRGAAAGAALIVGSAPAALAQGAGGPVGRDFGTEVARTVIWLCIAGAAFVLAFKVVDWTTPGDLRQQLCDGNVAMAVYVGALAVSAAIIIAALVS